MKTIDEESYHEIAKFIFNKLYKDEKNIDPELFVSEIYGLIFAYIKYASVHLGGAQRSIEFMNQILELMNISASDVVEELYRPEFERITSTIKSHMEEGKL